ncbi:DNA polymerase IV [Escherichia coli]|uniref:DNA polymerase IV n=1 Tax=Escherichia coli TaxID=562 RepID=A0A2X3K592_ECOLX|nr:DNA polymerase IV [Escherichia coli]
MAAFCGSVVRGLTSATLTANGCENPSAWNARWPEDIHHWSECEAIIERLYPELERRLAKVKPDLLIARQGVKLKFDDFQQTTQEHVWPRLNKADLIATARKTWDERRGGRGVRLVGLHVTLLDPQMERQLVLGL